MAEIKGLESLQLESCLPEEQFLLQVQTAIQDLLNRKSLRYRDLSKRLGVSEARVSQMFGDQAANLTIRTIARVFDSLGETPVLLSGREHARLLEGLIGPGSDEERTPTWQVLAAELDPEIVTTPQARVVEEIEESSGGFTVRHRDWIAAEPVLRQRAQG